MLKPRVRASKFKYPTVKVKKEDGNQLANKYSRLSDRVKV
jgi:hypothetical protein